MLLCFSSCGIKGKDKKESAEKTKTSVSSAATESTTASTTSTTRSTTAASTKKSTKTDKTSSVPYDGRPRLINSVLVIGDRAMEPYYHSDSNAEKYSGVINKTAASMPEGVRFFSILCPTAVEFYGTAEYRQGARSQLSSIQKVYSRINDDIITVDAYSELADKTDDYIYFRSDHHWTARGAYCAYKAFCEASGNTAPALESYKSYRINDFLGTLYSTTKVPAIAANPDYVECFEPAAKTETRVYNSAEMNEQTAVTINAVAKQVNSSNKYLAFIAGDEPLEKITTSNKNGRKVLVLKESFGNAFVPFLCGNYEEIFVVDPRLLTFNLSDFVSANSINDVIAINYLFAIGNSVYCKALGSMTP